MRTGGESLWHLWRFIPPLLCPAVSCCLWKSLNSLPYTNPPALNSTLWWDSALSCLKHFYHCNCHSPYALTEAAAIYFLGGQSESAELSLISHWKVLSSHMLRRVLSEDVGRGFSEVQGTCVCVHICILWKDFCTLLISLPPLHPEMLFPLTDTPPPLP